MSFGIDFILDWSFRYLNYFFGSYFFVSKSIFHNSKKTFCIIFVARLEYFVLAIKSSFIFLIVKIFQLYIALPMSHKTQGNNLEFERQRSLNGLKMGRKCGRNWRLCSQICVIYPTITHPMFEKTWRQLQKSIISESNLSLGV